MDRIMAESFWTFLYCWNVSVVTAMFLDWGNCIGLSLYQRQERTSSWDKKQTQTADDEEYFRSSHLMTPDRIIHHYKPQDQNHFIQSQQQL